MMGLLPAMAWTALAGVAVAFAAVNGATAADDADAAGRGGGPGSYVLLVDETGSLIGLDYRIDDGAIIVFRKEPILLQPDANEGLMVDRAFLPTRIVNSWMFAGVEIRYDGAPPAPESGDAAEIGVELLSSGIVQPPRLDDSQTMTFRWLGEETRAFSAGTVTARPYEASYLATVSETGAPRLDEAVSRRVYLPDLDVDLDAETWNRVADIRIGRAASSIELAAITWLMSDPPATMRDCIAAVVAKPGYLPYSREIGALERRSPALMTRGSNDLLEFGLADYNAVNHTYGIADQFRGCVGT